MVSNLCRKVSRFIIRRFPFLKQQRNRQSRRKWIRNRYRYSSNSNLPRQFLWRYPYPGIDTIGMRLLFCPSIQTGGKRGGFSMNGCGLDGLPYNDGWIECFPDGRKWRGHFPWVWKQPQKRIPAVFLFGRIGFVLHGILRGQVLLVGMRFRSWTHHVVKHWGRKR